MSMPNPNLDIHSLKISTGENLPHWHCHRAIYHISFRLADSVPQSVRERWLREREDLRLQSSQNDQGFSNESQKRVQYLYSERIEKYLESGFGECWLRKPQIAQLVIDALKCFDHIRYHLHAWCVMPNHVPIIVEALPGYDLSEIIHSWKSFTAHEANKKLGLTGPFWQSDAYNHIIRSKKEYDFQIQYTSENPEKARLFDWCWRWKGV